MVDEVSTKSAQDVEDKKAKEEGREPRVVDNIMKTVFEKELQFVAQNDSKPLWTKSPKDVTSEEYGQFFKTTFKEFLEPLAHNHFNVEGTVEFKGMLFIPGECALGSPCCRGGDGGMGR